MLKNFARGFIRVFITVTALMGVIGFVLGIFSIFKEGIVGVYKHFISWLGAGITLGFFGGIINGLVYAFNLSAISMSGSTSVGQSDASAHIADNSSGEAKQAYQSSYYQTKYNWVCGSDAGYVSGGKNHVLYSLDVGYEELKKQLFRRYPKAYFVNLGTDTLEYIKWLYQSGSASFEEL